MKNIKVTIQGLPPGLLMHRFPMEPIEALEKKSIEDQAELTTYRTPQKELYIPGTAIQRALVEAGKYSKGKGRASLQGIISACLFINPEYIILTPNKYIIDSRPVVVPATKGRILRHRALLPEWKADFIISYEEKLVTEQQIRKVLEDACSLVGFLDFRPAKKGPFGRAMIIEWKNCK